MTLNSFDDDSVEKGIVHKTDEEVRGARLHDGCLGYKVLIVFFSSFGSKDAHVDEVSLVRLERDKFALIHRGQWAVPLILVLLVHSSEEMILVSVK